MKIENPSNYPKGKHYVIIKFNYVPDRGYPDAVRHEVLATTDRSEWAEAIASFLGNEEKIIFFEVEKISKAKLEIKANIE